MSVLLGITTFQHSLHHKLKEQALSWMLVIQDNKFEHNQFLYKFQNSALYLLVARLYTLLFDIIKALNWYTYND
jgi:hypothetical protein